MSQSEVSSAPEDICTHPFLMVREMEAGVVQMQEMGKDTVERMHLFKSVLEIN